MARAFWSDEEKRVLKEIVKNNGDIKDCARILRRSEAAIFNMAYLMGISMSQKKEIDMDAFKQFLSDHRDK